MHTCRADTGQIETVVSLEICSCLYSNPSYLRAEKPMNGNTLGKYLNKNSAALLTALLVLTVFTGPAAAQGSTAEFEGIMSNLYDVVLLVLKYAGLVALGLGAIIWFTARKNSDRAENGMKLLIGGGAMTVFYFGVTAFVSMLEWIGTPP